MFFKNIDQMFDKTSDTYFCIWKQALRLSQNQSSSRGMSDGQTVSAVLPTNGLKDLGELGFFDVSASISIAIASLSSRILSSDQTVDSIMGGRSVLVSVVSACDVCLSFGTVRQHWGSSSISHSHGFGSRINPCSVVQLQTCLPVGFIWFELIF